jgi:hypothetical protein
MLVADECVGSEGDGLRHQVSANKMPPRLRNDDNFPLTEKKNQNGMIKLGFSLAG